MKSVKITNIEEILRNPTSRKLQNRLTPKQRFVLEMRYGYRDGYRYTYREIGELMGVSHVAIFKIEERARGRLEYLLPRERKNPSAQIGKWSQKTREKHQGVNT